MFNSGVSVEGFIESLKSELDTALPFEDQSYIDWINETEQFLYKTIIREKVRESQNLYDDDGKPKTVIKLENCDFEDITLVNACETGGTTIELMRVEPSSSNLFRNCYWKTDGGFGFSIDIPEYITIDTIEYYHVNTPVLKTNKDSSTSTVNLPIEHLEMLRCIIRAKAFMLCGEYAIAANWINMYNTYLETFKSWYTSTNTGLGV